MKYPTASLSIGLTVGLAIGLLFASVIALPIAPAESREPDKTLKLSFGHTGETGEFTFKRNGVYDRAELRRLNHFLRDWRRDEDANMDPHLLDLVWAIYQQTGSHDAIHVVSAYRSPATNEMLRSRAGSGVAKNSQHRLGKAMDWYLTDIPLATLRATAMKMQGGGVGYYPRSGSPFVHTDTGNVRAWPRMSREQLLALFPNGNTLHLPADGKPLPGYELALARRNAGGNTTLAYMDTAPNQDDETDRTGTTASASGWLKRVFKGSQQDDVASAAADEETDTGEPQPQIVDASLEQPDAGPRAPRPRPADAGRPVANAIDTTATIVASAEAEAPRAEPQNRPEPATFAAIPGTTEDAGALEASSEDAIAALTARIEQETPEHAASADPAVANPIDLAFAAAADQPPTSAADEAIIAAFAAVDASGSIYKADPALTAAVARRANDAQPQQPSEELAVAYAGSSLLPVEPAAAAETPAAETIDPPAAGIVLAPAPAEAYSGDETALVGLIQSQPTAPSASRLAMPTPASALMVAPARASAVADLRGRAGPPVDHFTGGERRQASNEQQGFFSRLFASLIE